jgi:hypothetical protein
MKMEDSLRMILAQPDTEEMVDAITLPVDATSLHFMQAIYRDSRQPMPRRMRAAQAALPFEHAKLQVTVDASRNFAALMEECARKSGRSNVIDSGRPQQPWRIPAIIETDPTTP